MFICKSLMNIFCVGLPRINHFLKSSIYKYTHAHTHMNSLTTLSVFSFGIYTFLLISIYPNPYLKNRKQQLAVEIIFFCIKITCCLCIKVLLSKAVKAFLVSKLMDSELSWLGIYVMLRLVVYSGLDLHPSGFSYLGLLQPLPITICSFTNSPL